MNRRLTSLLSVSAIAAALAWLSVWSWRGLIEQPDRFLNPALMGAVLIVLVGALGRWKLGRWYLLLPIQLVVLTSWLHHRLAGVDGPASWIPTPGGISTMSDRIADGAHDVNTYASPVEATHAAAADYLLVTSLLVVLAVDLLGCGLRRVPWAGLPVVVALTVPISVLDVGLSPVLFVTVALLFVLLLATDEVERVRTWAQLPDRGRPHDSGGRVDATMTVRGAAARIGIATAVGALVLPVLVPVADGFLGRGNGPGDGPGKNDPVRLVNPLVDLHRDLVRQDHIELLRARTEDPTTDYLRLTVLDSFDGRRWKPSERDLPATNKADGNLPRPPGLSASAVGRAAEWDLNLLPDFRTAWLPAPFPLTSLTPDDGDWRYDNRTMDFANVDEDTPLGIGYRLAAFHPEIEADDLDSAPPAPVALRDAMTKLPRTLPDVVRQTADRVTASGRGDYQKAVLLQDWFRTSGGFAYSLAPDSGSSTGALVRFITTEKIGYCEQFAAAMALMARSLDIPARVVVGFLSAEEQEDGSLLYTSDALHAWPELYFSGSGWVRFEPTPGARTGAPPAWTEQEDNPTPSALPTPTASATDRLPTRQETAETTPADAAGGSSSGNRLAWSVAAVLLLVLALVPGTLRRRRRAGRLHGTSSGPDAFALGLWTELLATAEDLGVLLPRTRSIRRVAAAIAAWVGSVPADDTDDLDELVRFVERARYGRGFEVDIGTRRRMATITLTWSHHLAGSVPRWRRWTSVMLPRSVLVRRDAAAESSEQAAQPVGTGEIR